ncbi:PepSY domain-containing protein [Leucobacter sp. M11]|uniref:PepSY domain-containing protein n=1 Tax=Leucobacter sp. M11 TaxID=2993565 RepID=UPI002D806BEB|nr:PepSY domain-containing protein [Leucobacter sp. M11]MEB4616413.1 PepSY domain-containing protein [Leucobacter sp. M11]
MTEHTQSMRRAFGGGVARRIIPIGLALGLGLTGLTACAPEGSANPNGSGNGSPTEASKTPGDGQSSGGVETTALPDRDQLLAAAKLAQEEAGGGTVISIDLEDRARTWEVTVAAGDGTETEVEISADGTSVVTPPRVEQDDPEDLAETVALLAGAKLDLTAAVDAALGELPDATVTELSLDSDRGKTLWEAELVTGNVKQQLDVDAATGEILPAR